MVAYGQDEGVVRGFSGSTCNVTTSSHRYLRHASLRVAQKKAVGVMIKQCEFGKYSCAPSILSGQQSQQGGRAGDGDS